MIKRLLASMCLGLRLMAEEKPATPSPEEQIKALNEQVQSLTAHLAAIQERTKQRVRESIKDAEDKKAAWLDADKRMNQEAEDLHLALGCKPGQLVNQDSLTCRETPVDTPHSK